MSIRLYCHLRFHRKVPLASLLHCSIALQVVKICHLVGTVGTVGGDFQYRFYTRDSKPVDTGNRVGMFQLFQTLFHKIIRMGAMYSRFPLAALELASRSPPT